MGKTNILVVDDLRSIRLTLGGILEDKGHNVVTVADGYQAIEAAKKSHFDVIFMDVRLPGMDGVETFEQVKKVDPKAAVIMMTGFTAEDLVERAIRGGAYTCIYKPFDMAKVISLVESIAK